MLTLTALIYFILKWNKCNFPPDINKVFLILIQISLIKQRFFFVKQRPRGKGTNTNKMGYRTRLGRHGISLTDHDRTISETSSQSVLSHQMKMKSS